MLSALEAEMVFIIRAMGGQTRTLLNRALKNGSCELTAFFDGPYGHPEDIRPFTTCIFIAGKTLRFAFETTGI